MIPSSLISDLVLEGAQRVAADAIQHGPEVAAAIGQVAAPAMRRLVMRTIEEIGAFTGRPTEVLPDVAFQTTVLAKLDELLARHPVPVPVPHEAKTQP